MGTSSNKQGNMGFGKSKPLNDWYCCSIYEPKVQIHRNKQGTVLVSQYYNTMKSLWLEFSFY